MIRRSKVLNSNKGTSYFQTLLSTIGQISWVNYCSLPKMMKPLKKSATFTLRIPKMSQQLIIFTNTRIWLGTEDSLWIFITASDFMQSGIQPVKKLLANKFIIATANMTFFCRRLFLLLSWGVDRRQPFHGGKRNAPKINGGGMGSNFQLGNAFPTWKKFTKLWRIPWGWASSSISNAVD